MGGLSNIQIPKIKLSIRVLGVVLAIIAVMIYWYASNNVIPEIEAKTTKLQNEIASLDATDKQLTDLYENMNFYLDETSRLDVETEKILEEFPTFMFLEDKILYADTLLKTDLAGYNIYEFSYGESNYKMSVVFGTEEKTLELYEVSLNASFSNLTYMQIKNLLDYGLDSNQRFVMSNMSMGYNEENGYISGDFSFYTYFIPGQSTPYEFPQSVIEGLGNSDRVDNLFGSRQDIYVPTDDE
jgi:hypothetical protein